MATYTWSIPIGKAITGTTYIKDTDNNISDTIDDLVDFVNGQGAHTGQGLTYDLIDKTSAQTISGIKTFSAVVKGIAPVANEDLTRKDYVDNQIATLNSSKIGAADYASSTVGGTVKMRISGTTLYITNNGSDA